MKKLIKSFELQIFVIALLLSLVHLWQYFDSGYNVNCIVRCVLFFLIGFFGLFFKEPFIYTGAFIGSLFVMQFDTFNNYSSFFFAYLLLKKYPKFQSTIFIIYAINIFIVCELHERYASHLLIHFMTCIIYYIMAEKERIKLLLSDKVELELTEDEAKILYQLEIENKSIYSIEGFSKPTVCRKLRSAGKRNGLSNKELRNIFLETNNDTISE